MSYQIGKRYPVRCVRIWKCRDGERKLADLQYADRYGWVPVIGPEHEDAEHINFPHLHYHVDLRFVAAHAFNARLYALKWAYPGKSEEEYLGRLLGLPVTTKDADPVRFDGLVIETEVGTRPLLCKRAMPTFPRAIARWIPQLETAYAECQLKPGLVCPHRGIPLADFVQPDGTVTCPGHGLRFNAVTGRLLAASVKASDLNVEPQQRLSQWGQSANEVAPQQVQDGFGSSDLGDAPT